MAVTRLAREVSTSEVLTEDVNWRTPTGANFTPTTVEYKVMNLDTRVQIIDWTTVGSPDADMTITFPATAFPTQDTTKESEIHEVTLFADRALSPNAAIVFDVTVRRAAV